MSDYGEPWRVDEVEGQRDPGNIYGAGSDIGLIAVALWPTCQSARQNEFRRRIIACVNACAGIPTEVLMENRALFAQEATRFDEVALAHRERRERAALAALTGLLAKTGWNSSEMIADAVHLADALVAALDATPAKE